MNTTEHLLACLAEEGGEVTQEATKALRFGIDDNFSGRTVRERLVNELNDLLGVAALCVDHGILPADWQHGLAQIQKKQKVRKLMLYARTRGALEEPKPVEAV